MFSGWLYCLTNTVFGIWSIVLSFLICSINFSSRNTRCWRILLLVLSLVKLISQLSFNDNFSYIWWIRDLFFIWIPSSSLWPNLEWDLLVFRLESPLSAILTSFKDLSLSIYTNLSSSSLFLLYKYCFWLDISILL